MDNQPVKDIVKLIATFELLNVPYRFDGRVLVAAGRTFECNGVGKIVNIMEGGI